MTKNMIPKALKVNRIPKSEHTDKQVENLREGLVWRAVGGTWRRTDNDTEEAGRKQRGGPAGKLLSVPVLQSEGLGGLQRAVPAVLRCKPDRHQLEREDGGWQKEATVILSKGDKKEERKRQEATA